jgi:hypothetical protein
MPRSSGMSLCETFDCSYCGAVYAVRYAQLPVRDSESAYCKNCHRKMSHWNSTEQPSYTLIERPLRDRAGLCLPKTSSSAIGAARLPFVAS